MKAMLHSGLKLAATLVLLARLAPACGDPKADLVAGTNAKLAIPADGGQFRIGEAVYASLILPEGSKLPTGTLTRASCTSLEFKVEPHTGWHDPWADWYESGIPQHATGRDGPYSCGVAAQMIGQPTPSPQITFTLNDWVQFDRPGKYKISVTYRTEFRDYQDVLDDPYDDRKTAVLMTLSTDAVAVEVLPESASAGGRAADSLAELRKYYHNDDPQWGESRPFRLPEWAEYSQAEAVVPLLTEFYEAGSNAAKRGLIASPHQGFVVREMEKAVVSPRHSMSFDFMDALAFNAARLQHPQLFRPWESNVWTAEWEASARKKNQAYLSALAKYTRELLLTLPRKHEDAQRDGFRTALLILARWDVPKKDELRKLAGREAAELWPKMKEPPNISDEEWRIVASPELLPILRKTPDFYVEQMGWFRELAPQEARRRLLAAAAQGDWETAWSWASLMPEINTTSARLDRLLLTAFQEETDDDQKQRVLDLVLLRVGGADLVGPMRTLLDSETCMGQPSVWAFLLKQEGRAAEDSLVRRYEEQKSDRTCDADAALQEILRQGPRTYWSSRLETIVEAQLDMEDPIARGAAQLLEVRGSAGAEDALWARLQKWHRSPPLRATSGGELAPEDDLEYALLEAILEGRSWLPTQPRIDRLHRLCVHQCRSLLWARSVDQVQPLTVDGMRVPPLFSGGRRSDAVRDFEAVWGRFPAGSRFAVTVSPGMQPLTAHQMDSRYPELGRFMREHQFIIVDRLAFDEYGRCRRGEGSSPE